MWALLCAVPYGETVTYGELAVRLRAKNGGRKSFRHEELNPEYFLPKRSSVLVPYLDMLQKDLDDRPD